MSWPVLTLYRRDGTDNRPTFVRQDMVPSEGWGGMRYIPESALLSDAMTDAMASVLRYDDSAQTVPELALALREAALQAAGVDGRQ